MIEMTPTQVSPALRALFATSGHTFRRCFAVLDGISGGRILTDNPAAPNWGAVHELSSDGSLFLAGSLSRDLVTEIINVLRRDRIVTIGLTDDDPWLAFLPDPSSEGTNIDFEDRASEVVLELLINPPASMRLARIDRELEPYCAWSPWMYVDGESAIEHGIGYCLLDDDRVVSEAYAGPAVDGVLEMAVITGEDYRRRGLGKIVSARTLLECERLGYQTWWNTSLENVASASIARSLGYRTERHYRTYIWSKSAG